MVCFDKLAQYDLFRRDYYTLSLGNDSKQRRGCSDRNGSRPYGFRGLELSRPLGGPFTDLPDAGGFTASTFLTSDVLEHKWRASLKTILFLYE